MGRILALVSAIVFAGSTFAQVPGGNPPGTVIPAGRVVAPGSGQPSVGAAPALPPSAPIDPVLDAHLKGWETKMKGVVNLFAKVELKIDDKEKLKTKNFTGSFICSKPALARMKTELVGDPSDYTAWLSDGRSVYQYDGTMKKLTMYDIPKGQNGINDNLLMEFLSGSMTAEGTKARFDLKLLKVDSAYVYIQIQPRLAKDKQDFDSVTLVLVNPNIDKKFEALVYLPAMVIMSSQNNTLVQTWVLKDQQSNVQGLKAEDFKPVQPPKDWTVEKGNAPAANPQPRVVRPSGGQ